MDTIINTQGLLSNYCQVTPSQKDSLPAYKYP